MNLIESFYKPFKKRPIEDIKQPQEYFCSNECCLNEIARFSPLAHLLTEKALDNLSLFYCVDCIVQEEYI
jgi:hypothetical protein